MFTILDILKVVVIIITMGFLFKRLFDPANDNKLWSAFKVIGIAFSILIVISVVEFIIATGAK